MTTQQPEALRVASWLITAPQKTTIGDMLLGGRELRRQHARIAELEAQLAATHPTQQGLEKDAARYRWLRNKSTVLHGTAWLGSATAYQRDVDFLRRDDALAALDAAIDAALAAQAKQGGAANG